MAVKPKWVSTESELPEIGVFVKVRTSNDEEVYARRIFNGRWALRFFDGSINRFDVTHWRKDAVK